MVRPDSNQPPETFENASEPHQPRIASWRMEALRGLRGWIETFLAAERERPRGKDRAICEEIRLPAKL